MQDLLPYQRMVVLVLILTGVPSEHAVNTARRLKSEDLAYSFIEEISDGLVSEVSDYAQKLDLLTKDRDSLESANDALVIRASKDEAELENVTPLLNRYRSMISTIYTRLMNSPHPAAMKVVFGEKPRIHYDQLAQDGLLDQLAAELQVDLPNLDAATAKLMVKTIWRERNTDEEHSEFTIQKYRNDQAALRAGLSYASWVAAMIEAKSVLDGPCENEDTEDVGAPDTKSPKPARKWGGPRLPAPGRPFRGMGRDDIDFPRNVWESELHNHQTSIYWYRVWVRYKKGQMTSDAAMQEIRDEEARIAAEQSNGAQIYGGMND